MLERDRIGNLKRSGTRPAQLNQVRSYAKLFSQIFGERANVSSRCTNDANLQVCRPVIVRIEDRTVFRTQFEFTNSNSNWPALNFFAAAGHVGKLFYTQLLPSLHQRAL